jgi:hypothetical protein
MDLTGSTTLWPLTTTSMRRAHLNDTVGDEVNVAATIAIDRAPSHAPGASPRARDAAQAVQRRRPKVWSSRT